MKEIILLSTGGTIASKQDPKTGLMMAGEQTGEDLLAQCNHKLLADKGINVTVQSVFQIPSNQMTFSHCLELISLMNALKNEKQVDGFVITHGTDTLEESAYFVSLLWQADTPVVFTGAQFSPTERNTDAFHNITSALLVAADENSKKASVCLVFNDQILPAQYAEKTHASNINGFTAPQYGNMGIVDQGRVHFFNYPACVDKISLPSTSLAKVEIVKSYVNMDTQVFDFLASNNTQGIVLEAFGRGHVDIGTAQKVAELTAKGIVVVTTSTCAKGETAEVYGFPGGLNDLIKKGGINGRDYSSKKARIKLMLLLTQGLNMADIAQRFNEY